MSNWLCVVAAVGLFASHGGGCRSGQIGDGRAGDAESAAAWATPYRALRDTQWSKGVEDGRARYGAIRAGEHVSISREQRLSAEGTVTATYPPHGAVQVRPADFREATWTHTIVSFTPWYARRPDARNMPAGTIPRGTRLLVVDGDGGHVRVFTESGIFGYVDVRTLEPR